MTFAVIATGGKQYLVQKGTKVKIEKIEGKAKDAVTFDKVLLLSDDSGKACTLGKPTISGAKVTGKIIRQGRAKKVTVVKYKNKIHYTRTQGHRQPFTEVEIIHIQSKKG